MAAPRAPGVLHLVRWDRSRTVRAGARRWQGCHSGVTPHRLLEMIGQSLAERYGPTRGPLVALYRPARKAWLAPLAASSRNRPGLQAVPTSVSGVRNLLRVLRWRLYRHPARSGAACRPGRLGTLFASPPTMTLLPRLAQQSGAAVLLCWCERPPPGQGYVMLRASECRRIGRHQCHPEAAAAAVNAGWSASSARPFGQYLWSYALQTTGKDA